jgi:phosphatidylserine decarboxylase
MKKSLVDRVFQQESINFWLTNRIPRRSLTLFMGWFSRVENPLIANSAIAIWRLFADDLRLYEAKRKSFRSLHDCFIRELKEGVRPIDPDPSVVISPCDAIVGAMGTIQGTELIQAKGFPYTLGDLLDDPGLVERYRDGRYVTLRLKSSMYHRFHAPCDCRVREVNYISGDVWNVNPATLRRVERLYCKNERAVIPLISTRFGAAITLVPVAAILVASIHLNFLDVLLNLKYRGPNRIPCQASFRKGDEMGYFHHGSTIIVFATAELEPVDGIQPGALIRMGRPLMRTAASPQPALKRKNGLL